MREFDVFPCDGGALANAHCWRQCSSLETCWFTSLRFKMACPATPFFDNKSHAFKLEQVLTLWYKERGLSLAPQTGEDLPFGVRVLALGHMFLLVALPVSTTK
ncbi:hypothetical protein LEN26_017237 [Aphanomyces euteiches]|nr:hypothetical protein LEN26_017237 [Aphanomyces euteiches]KAH9127032.1 hypothetical protein AeMF1_002600 [Aphanomyces euteiches]KAH9131409.1 hypothetical protein AeNC1_019659 [Aphanomyces euteiches]